MDVAFGVIGTAGIALHSARRVYELVADIRGAPDAVQNVRRDVKALYKSWSTSVACSLN